MRTKFSGILTLFLALMVQIGLAQEKTVSGTVTSAADGMPLPGVNILVKGTSTGTQTDFDGNFTIDASEGQTLVVSYIGMKTTEVVIGASSAVNIQLEEDAQALEEVVVTALGISREKKQLGYSSQEVGGDAVSTVQSGNVANALSGKVSGLQIKRNNNMGGSTNVVIRGSNSITGNNQALWVVDGVPIDNSNINDNTQLSGGSGFDFGNGASDINPDDIESMNVLKGAAATALYGSRAANGAIIITTKKGKKDQGLGVTITNSTIIGKIDKKTFPEYQKEYGAGYGPSFRENVDFDGDGVNDKIVLTGHDASYGPAFDPNLMVYQWNSFDPALPTYMQKTPWVAAKNGAAAFFEQSVTQTNSVSVSGGTDESSFRLSYTRLDQDGILPNSKLKRHTINFSASHNLSDKITVSGAANYIKTNVTGRNETGYSDNIVSAFRQWWQTNVDLKEQRNAYFSTGRNITWNTKSQNDLVPAYHDNPYFQRYESYESDRKNRFFGFGAVNYDVNDWFSITGRASVDTYDYIQEERVAVGSNRPSQYQRYNRNFTELNYDLLLNFNTNISDRISFTGLLGMNSRRSYLNTILQSTNGGLKVPGLYALNNSVNPILPPTETEEKKAVDGIFASASFGFDNMLFLEGTIRRDVSSTLPKDNNTYYYPSVTASYVFSNDIEWLTFGKLRVNYAEVGNDAPFASILDTYDKDPLFGDNATMFSVSDEKRNPDLKSERTKSWEAGLELQFFQRRLGLDLSFYQTNTVDQILPVPVTVATGYSRRFVNSGEVRNRGVEVSLNATPVKTEDFSWDVGVNWSLNRNKVLELYDDIDNIVLYSYQSNVTYNVEKGQPLGVLKGTDFVYDDQGNKVVGEDGLYLVNTSTTNEIGNVNPDWMGGLSNTFRYKNLALNFLIDMQKGGSVYSLDMWYGTGTGLYKETAGLNDLGNPKRAPLANGGGIIHPGVKENGEPNDVRLDMSDYGNLGYEQMPNRAYVYDASYIKLREVSLTYTLPKKYLEDSFFNNLELSLVGSNLWIIHKNLPYADPEAGLSSGNSQGFQSGVLPTTRDVGFNVKLQF
ncbi:SusC/RagA family TonB-linked outer membrane protein [Sinomicrobium weinanense]|uniref:SusC/RagA family TonB-linked outer membrane protein n=1 Tax=Sinomicrobium weinanense TaxID=2842200 RepID=A0A926JQR2_9FLAO|nr:SusC/RagA family TonB-linked outer membrane protein [Sinomicrobium weinanense]MBC9795567.1 SusC/RagA family TonB-linked outer membrane protein [Sinomicrobium weinanense]MBU3124588.1 SusC/RagA family TonB-linked outer membrane protein [Sinomicrobium weinanense]